MAYDDVLYDGVDTIDATRWNAMITNLKARSVDTHAHTEFQLHPMSDYWYIYKVDSTYYAKNMSTGAIGYSGTVFSTIFQNAVSAITYAGRIRLGTGTFLATSGLTTDDKSIIIEGSGWGKGTPLTSNPGTVLKPHEDLDDYLLTFGTDDAVTEGAGIRNIAFQNDASNVTCLGAVRLYNTVNSFVDHCYISEFVLGDPTAMSAILIDADYTGAGSCNRIRFNHILSSDFSIFLGTNANNCIVEGNHIYGNGTLAGINCDGTGATIASPYGCLISGNRVRNCATGLKITAGSNDSGRHTVVGNTFDEHTTQIEIASGTGIGDCTFTGNVIGASCTNKVLDSGNVKSHYVHNQNYVTDNWGVATSKAHNSTIEHGLDGTPTAVFIIGTETCQSFAVTDIGSTTFTLGITKLSSEDICVAGTTQTVYWRAWI